MLSPLCDQRQYIKLLLRVQKDVPNEASIRLDRVVELADPALRIDGTESCLLSVAEFRRSVGRLPHFFSGAWSATIWLTGWVGSPLLDACDSVVVGTFVAMLCTTAVGSSTIAAVRTIAHALEQTRNHGAERFAAT